MNIEIPSPPPPLDDQRPASTRVIAVGALKGGTGKSRLAMLIALFLATVMERRVVVIDADSASQTSSKWPGKAVARGYTWPIEMHRHPFDTLDTHIDMLRARGDVDDIIVDIGGGNYGPFLAAVRRSHKLIVPLCPDEGDIEQAPPTREAALMGAARNTVGGCMMYYLFNRCDRRSEGELKDAIEQLTSDMDGEGAYPLLDVVIPILTPYRRTYGRIPGIKVPKDENRVAWKDLDQFIPFLVETEIITRAEALGTGLIIDRELVEAGV